MISDISFDFIQSNDALIKILSLLKQDKLFIDTEFVRRSTYWPVFGLMQIGTSDHIYIIDAVHVDMMLLKPLFEDDKIEKWFYSAKQDIEILHNLYQMIPPNIHDLQLAYTFAGQGDHVGLERAVNQVLKEEMDKQAQFSDWVQRPLTAEQLAYAAIDVICIRNLYEPIITMLQASGHTDWYTYYVRELFGDAKLFDYADKAVRRLRFKLQNLYGFHVLDALATERELLADQHNKPRQHIMPDHVLEGIADRLPETFSDFKAVVFDKKLHNKPLRPNSEVMKKLYHAYVAAREELVAIDKEQQEALMKKRLDLFQFTVEQQEKIQEIKDALAKLAEETKIPVHYFMPLAFDFDQYFQQPEAFVWAPWFVEKSVKPSSENIS